MEAEQWQAAADCGDSGYWAVYSLAGRKRALVFEPAHARLIAAAPDLLAALEAIVGQAQPNGYGYDAARVALDDEWRASARAAIARAKGAA